MTQTGKVPRDLPGPNLGKQAHMRSHPRVGREVHSRTGWRARRPPVWQFAEEQIHFLPGATPSGRAPDGSANAIPGDSNARAGATRRSNPPVKPAGGRPGMTVRSEGSSESAYPPVSLRDLAGSTRDRRASVMRAAKKYRPKQFRISALEEMLDQNESIGSMAARLHVTERTVQRYLVELGGRTRSRSRYDEFKPLIMEHLHRYPHEEFTSTELTRVLRVGYGTNRGAHQGGVLNPTLRRLEQEGLVRSVLGIRTDREYSPPLPATRWRLAHPTEDQTLFVKSQKR